MRTIQAAPCLRLLVSIVNKYFVELVRETTASASTYPALKPTRPAFGHNNDVVGLRFRLLRLLEQREQVS